MVREPKPISRGNDPLRRGVARRATTKYLKLRSLTWWASVVPLMAGLILAAEPLHGWAGLSQTLRNITGDVPPVMLINAGLAGIGIRGALQ